MENWPRIPGTASAAGGVRGSGGGLPPPGTVVMASVEENLGDNTYTLRWGGNRIAVSSRTPLTTGQSLILKSEMSAEGKLTLVVQGPALPEPGSITGPIIYKPPERTQAERQDAQANRQADNQTAGGPVAAGVAKAVSLADTPLTAALLGMVLEPLDEAAAQALLLLAAAEAEKKAWRKEEKEKNAQAGDTTDANDAETEAAEGEVDPAADEAAPAAKPRSREAAIPAVGREPSAAAGDGTAAASPAGETRPAAASRPAVSEVGGQPAAPPSENNVTQRPATPDAVQPDAAQKESAAAPAPLPTVTRPAFTVSEIPAVSVDGETAATLPANGEAPEAPDILPPPGTPPRDRPETAAPPPPEAADGAKPAGGGDAVSSSPEIRPEVYLKETLTQLVKVAELPLASPSADSQSLGVGGRMPPEVADKAADILLRAAGLTPDEAARQAARALLENNVPVDRQNVQALLALTAGVAEGDREAVLAAAARLAAKDIPLAAPLAGGLAEVMQRRAGVHTLLEQSAAALSAAEMPPEIRPLLDASRDLLGLLQVDLGREDAAAVLERYLSSFGREALGKALALVENAAQSLLENHPQLTKIDAALAAILIQLEDEMLAPAPGSTPETAAPAAPPPEGEAGPAPFPPATAAPPRQSAQSVIQAYLNAPRAFPGLESLNLPPMPTLAKLPAAALPTPPVTIPPVEGAPLPMPETGAAVAVPPGETPVPAPGFVPETPAAGGAPTPAQPSVPESARPPAPPAGDVGTAIADDENAPPSGLEKAPQSSVLNRLGPLFQHPGANRPEMELLKPSGFLERFLNSSVGREPPETVKADAEALFRELLSEKPEKVAQALRELPQKSQQVLRETAARLTRLEAEVVRNEPALTRLADAASSLRDLGRQLLAVKAENLAGQNREPGVMLAEVPFKLADDAGDGRMQMFYRRAKKSGDSWTSRVILDLNTTGMGPVLGDMRFFGQDMALNMFLEKADTADFLRDAADELAEHLLQKGFRLKSRFMVMPPPPKPQLSGERPEIAGQTGAAATPGETAVPGRRSGRLDVKG